ncbi:VWA domain-containing protein [Meiothermus ruber]|jgi:Ca-activated chloride channel family protein|uniref:von Willebrand factor type A n=1 Tax=Meiothermus ruber (strain ATCC 35948 / DSM 1279 / VKM B-1258 / 21) TaxID=504728 RepID=D3PRJ5_MEIRD|nr:VWA domain-containing protein [Meiothermus ruber]ADD28078.1 von Willebrand factor type A [Meiothermus ruber DSM 1279]AGK04547.1 von Willebrand factor type A [Meiothermus ruber DSM 1279]MCL6528789.1 VWA domain-containing protein [Meiothermus ruber]GAO75026.1 von Willebrand factor type A [Meiothermus ruber H328]
MSFTWPAFLWLLLLIPAFIGFLAWVNRRRERTAEAFADAHLLGSVVRRPPKAHVRWPLALQLLALCLLLLAAARPVASPPLPTNKAAIVLAVDTSRSMLATDLNPNRLEAAKATARKFIELAPPTTQIGLVSFSDSASALVMPTTDRQKLLEAIERLKPAQNTSIENAIITGVRMLPGRNTLRPPAELQPPGLSQPDPLQGIPDLPLPQQAQPPANLPPGSLVILSDGASNVSSNPTLPTRTTLEVAARFAKNANVRLYTFPMGQPGGAVTQIEGRHYYIPFEPRNLEQLAQATGGKNTYPPTEEALRAIVKELGVVIRWEGTKTEVSSLLSALAAALMILAAGLSLRWQRRVP